MQEKQEMNIKKLSSVKIIVIALLIVSVIVFGSLSWFTMSKEVEGSGTQMTASDLPFELRVEGENIGYSDLYAFLDESFSKNTRKITNTSDGGDTIRWHISGDKDTIKPGAQGVLEFTIISKDSNVNKINYSLCIQCYTADTEVANNVETVTRLTEITPSSSHTEDEKNGAKYLKSHLMFFKGRTGNSETTYQYSEFINDISDFTLTPETTTTAGEYSAKIYWIWPNTIGQIMLNSSLEADQNYLGANIISVLNSTGETNDRTSMTTYLTTNAATMFEGSDSYSTLINTLYSNRTVGSSFRTQYDSLSAGYNAADLIIGKNVDYITVLLQATAN